MQDLSAFRARIDAIDGEMVRLFEARMDVARQVAAYKQKMGMAVLQPARERAVLDGAAARLTDPRNEPGVRGLFAALMAASRDAQKALLEGEAPEAHAWKPQPRVAYPGAAGAFSEEAAHAFFGEDVCALACATFQEVALLVARGAADYAVFPLENSTAGSVLESYGLLEAHGLRIVGTQSVRVAHQLMGLAGAKLDQVRTVRSHPQALLQCGRFLQAHPHLNAVPCQNTALAARDLRDPSVAAIASARAAALYGLQILASDIQDVQGNTTHFVVVAAPEGQTQ